ncbi:MAG: ABC transporter ATP-binding protein [Gammaproteobacteria bacterium]|nr:ABC transporter ATP-binding protein [Gammaproteobacteria bacterium]
MDTAALMVRNIRLSYQDGMIVNDFSLSLKPQELGCLLGPSGCGKSTLLRAIAGFQELDSGEIWLDNELLSTERHRDIALFPHLTVAENIAFGLAGWSEESQDKRIAELLELIGLTGLNQRYPHELSGGQQQRVALARAMAPKPKLLLLDEPFSGLDTELRGRLASEVRTILKSDGICSLLVTHDQREAFDFADRIAVMHDGHICQFDTPFNLYHEPTSPFVAHFVGPGEMIDARVEGPRSVSSPLGVLTHDADLEFEVGSDVQIFLRPDDLIHDDDSSYQATLVGKHFRGAHHLYEVKLDNGVVLGCFAPSHHNHAIGERIGVSLDIEHLVVFPK